MNVLTPKEIVAELDAFIIGQDKAKRMVAVAMRNRWRRQQIDPELRDEIAPKNIIMIGPTGVGKTEIARRLAKLAQSPFVKVEATKFTEVGYVGRDVESIIRDLMEIGVSMVRGEETAKIQAKAEANAEERLLDLLLPKGRAKSPAPGSSFVPPHAPIPGAGLDRPIPMPAGPVDEAPLPGDQDSGGTREKLRALWRDGKLEDRSVDMEVKVQGPNVEIMAMPGMEDMEMQFKDMLGRVFPPRRKQRRMKVKDAYAILVQEESERLVDMDKVSELAKERVEQSGIVFLDEIDKIVSSAERASNAEISREGVQRDLLPIVEGCVVNTKYGMVKSDHVLFIAAGAFHVSKPSDLVPELQGRFPLRVELTALDKKDFLRILTEPKNALTIQYTALLATEGVDIAFTPEGLEAVAAFAEQTNQETENIGARRLYTILEKILADLSFEAPDMRGAQVTIDREYVLSRLADVMENRDLSRYIL